jgi:enamine deaminase RidA (YjgF/YER057c/UK114 family)
VTGEQQASQDIDAEPDSPVLKIANGRPPDWLYLSISANEISDFHSYSELTDASRYPTSDGDRNGQSRHPIAIDAIARAPGGSMSKNVSSPNPEQRLIELGIKLPHPPVPLGAYVEVVQTGHLLFLSGTLPIEEGVPKFLGRIGADLTIEDGRGATRLAALNALALAKTHLGTLDRVTRVVRLGVSLVTSSEFREHPMVADAASELFVQVFGADKISTRLVFGMASLPVGVCVVLETIFEISP